MVNENRIKTAREKVLEYVRARRTVTAGELARSFGMSAANARRHLGLLADEGLLEVIGLRPSGGRGRPTQVYAPASRLLGDNLPGLAATALDLLLEGLSQGDRQSMWIRLGQRMASGQVSLPGAGRAAAARRLTEAVRRLNELGYAARWEAAALGPRLTFSRCPYEAVLERHPDICYADAALIETLCGAPAALAARLIADGQGGRVCRFNLAASTRSGF
jgi:predicted ArsR family transcriptional regulator